jgi:hypothetical protein
MPAGHAVDHVGEVSLRIKTVELGRLQHGIKNGGTLAAGFGPEEQKVLAGDGNRPVILPISGRIGGSRVPSKIGRGSAIVVRLAGGAKGIRTVGPSREVTA